MEKMPFIQINILEGRSPEKKERLIREVSDLVSEVLEAPVESVRVMINEMEAEHWGIAGESVKKRRETSNK
jgi:4-oxalocrotonate tautomerase